MFSWSQPSNVWFWLAETSCMRWYKLKRTPAVPRIMWRYFECLNNLPGSNTHRDHKTVAEQHGKCLHLKVFWATSVRAVYYFSTCVRAISPCFHNRTDTTTEHNHVPEGSLHSRLQQQNSPLQQQNWCLQQQKTLQWKSPVWHVSAKQLWWETLPHLK